MKRSILSFVLCSALLASMPLAASHPAAAQDASREAGDAIVPASDGWQTYVNARYGTRLTYPADLFTADEPPENEDGRVFLGENSQVEVFAWTNSDNEDASSLKRRLVGSQGYDQVTYSPSGSNWLVLSGYRGDRIFYEKYFFRGDVIHAFGIEFPRDRKPFYAPIVERIEDSFRAG